MKVVHVVPRPCIFEGVIQRNSDALGHECLFYDIVPRIGIPPRNLISLYLECKRRPGHLFVFHRVPHLLVLTLSLLLRDFHYALFYWGEDYYSTFIREADFEAHCLAKSPMLRQVYYERPRPRLRPRLPQVLLRHIGFLVLRRAAGIVALSPKMFRILRVFHFTIFGRSLRTPQLRIRGYSHDSDTRSAAYAHQGGSDSLTVLICHSAAPTVAHKQSLAILREYQKRWRARIHVRGFLSYSGGDEAARDRLERELVADADFAESVYFERSFLLPDELSRRLKEVDVAVFSSLRDEGVGLLTQFVKIGGMVSFNRFSINYDFFRVFCPAKLLAHEKFMELDPMKICSKRQESAAGFPKMLELDELDKLELENGKLKFTTLHCR
jgi:hypothetical protein